MLLHCDAHGYRWDAVGYDFQPAPKPVQARWNVEVGRDGCRSRGYAHRAVTVGASVENMIGAVIRNAYQWIIGGSLVFIAEGRRL